jgi:L,D-peptidoglycan transpeptidase YkuD (ErfK/YbiS/YcfS/YnhG family)
MGFLKIKMLGFARLVAAIGSALKFTAVAPADYVVKKQHEEHFNKIKEKCSELSRNTNIHPEIKHKRIR